MKEFIEKWQNRIDSLRLQAKNENITFEARQKLNWEATATEQVLNDLKTTGNPPIPHPSIKTPGLNLVHKIMEDHCKQTYGVHYSDDHLKTLVQGGTKIVDWVFKNN